MVNPAVCSRLTSRLFNHTNESSCITLASVADISKLNDHDNLVDGISFSIHYEPCWWTYLKSEIGHLINRYTVAIEPLLNTLQLIGAVEACIRFNHHFHDQ